MDCNYKNQEVLEKLYRKEKCSMCQIARKFGVSSNTILYWLRRHGIFPKQKRGRQKREHFIPKEILEELYIKRKLSLPEIAKRFELKSHTILYKLLNYDIPIRSRSEALKIRWKRSGKKMATRLRKYQKTSFSGNLKEKAYLIGLRAGDLHAYLHRQLIRVSTGSTHPAQIKMFKEVFEKYSHICICLVKNHLVGKEWNVRCDLDSSFSFLISKPNNIPRWILKDDEAFYSFLAGYADSEGSWNILRNNKNSIRLEFRLCSCDKTILKQIKRKLEKLGFNPRFYKNREGGNKSSSGIINRRDYYSVCLFRKSETVTLAKTLLPLSHHDEKIQKMRLMLKTENLKKWNDVKEEVQNLRESIKESRLLQK